MDFHDRGLIVSVSGLNRQEGLSSPGKSYGVFSPMIPAGVKARLQR